MEPSTRKRRVFKFALWAGWSLVLVYALCVSMFVAIPGLLNHYLIPDVATRYGIPVTARVGHVGLNTIHVTDLMVGDAQQPAIAVRHAMATYRPTRPVPIRDIRVDGLDIRCEYTDGRFTFPGLDIQALMSKMTSEKEPTPTRQRSSLFQLPISSLTVTHGNLICRVDGTSWIIPFELQLNVTHPKTAELTLRLSPLGHVVDGRIQLTQSWDEGRGNTVISANVAADIRISPATRQIQLPDREPIHVSGQLTGWIGDNQYQFHTSAQWEKVHLILGGGLMDVISPAMMLSISVNGNGPDANLDYDFRVQAPKLTWNTAEARLKTMTGTGTIQVSENQTTAGLDLKLENVSVAHPMIQVQMPEIRLKVDATPSPWKCLGRLDVSGGTIKVADMGVVATGLQTHLPLAWPEKLRPGAGSFRMDTIRVAGLEPGGVHGTIRQKGTRLQFRLKHYNRLIPNSTGSCSGTVSLESSGPSLDMKFSATRKKTANVMDLKKLSPLLSGWYANGNVIMEGNLQMGPHPLSGSFTGRFTDGTLTCPAKSIFIEGINAGIDFPDLPRLTTSPGRQLKFQKATMGDFTVQDGWVQMRMDGNRSVFVEKIQFQWCDGVVTSYDLSFGKKNKSLSATFYCDRLNLAGIFKQLGIAEAEGDGSVNGKIPVTLSGQRIIFNDGFLYSTPGLGGTIHVKNTQRFTKGIPVDTLQYFQMELAREALKDFQYNWVKLRLNTEKEYLVLNMQFDGKPSGPLPFEYKEELGGFARVEAGSPGSLFQGIRLDTNIRLPLDSFLRYKQLLNLSN